MNKLELFGISLDPDEGGDAVQRKVAFLMNGLRVVEPYDALVEELGGWLQEVNARLLGKIPVETWLTPNPTPEDLVLLSPLNFAVFLDSEGCREYRATVKRFVEERVEGIPVMVGIEHSMTGGVLDALAERYGSEELGVFVLDSHFDAIPSSVRNDLIAYAREKRRDYEKYGYTPEDYVFSPTGRKDSYNAGSFLRYLVEEAVVKPENLLVFAPLDYPHEKVLAEEDYRVKRFVKSYMELVEMGVKVVPRDLVDAVGVEESLKKFLDGWTPRRLYISVDVDIAARTALIGSKFIDLAGILEAQVYEALAHILSYASKKNIEVIGLDLMEIEPYRAGGLLEDGSADRTYEVAANIVRAVFSNEILLEGELLEALNNPEKSKPKLLEELQRRGYLEKMGKKFRKTRSLEVLKNTFKIKKKEGGFKGGF